MEPIEFLVCVRCFTFNHASYIEDAMNGFCMQKTNFPYVCVIVDDASTDGEPEVIMKFVSRNFNMEDNSVVRNEETDDYIMTFAQHKTNKNCFFAVYSLKYNHYSIKKSKMEYLSEFLDHVKYHALCEGDDYWIAPEKLQKQVDIMEKDDSIGLVYTKAKKVINRNRQVSGIIGKKFSSIDELVVDNKIPTLTTCYRKTVYDICQKELGCNLSGLSLGDYQLWLMFKIKSEVAFYEKVCAIYRVLEESASHSKSIDKMLKYYSDKYIVQSYFIQKYPYLFRNKKNHSIILEQFEWDKYRVFQRNLGANYYLSRKSFNTLNLKHKLVYCINVVIQAAGLCI